MSDEQEVAAFMIFAAFMIMAGEVGVRLRLSSGEGAPCDDDTILCCAALFGLGQGLHDPQPERLGMYRLPGARLVWAT